MGAHRKPQLIQAACSLRPDDARGRTKAQSEAECANKAVMLGKSAQKVRHRKKRAKSSSTSLDLEHGNTHCQSHRVRPRSRMRPMSVSG